MIKVDKKKCIGCGLCESIAPESFRMGNDMKADATGTKADAKTKDAAKSCPVQAITLG